MVVALQDPPPNLLPGLSATARITTSTRAKALAIPIQALTIRQRADLATDSKGKPATAEAAAPADGKDPRKNCRACLFSRTKRTPSSYL